MVQELLAIIHNPYVQLMLGGWAVAARMDYEAFESWQTPGEALAYNWKIAVWRWFKGAVIGLLTAKVFA